MGPAMNQHKRLSGHLIYTKVELNWSLNNTGQTKNRVGNYTAEKSDKRTYLDWKRAIYTGHHTLSM